MNDDIVLILSLARDKLRCFLRATMDARMQNVVSATWLTRPHRSSDHKSCCGKS